MPAVKSWFPRIPLILQHLESSAQAVYTRAELQTLFQIGRSQAAALMQIAGGEVHGIEATVSRDNLRYYVTRCPEADAYIKEQARQDALAKQLQLTSEEKRQRGAEISGTAPQDEWTRWGQIANVSFEPGVMRIAHSGQADLLHTLWLMSKALANEPKEFARLCGEVEHVKPALAVGRYEEISEADLREMLRPATPEEIERLCSPTSTSGGNGEGGSA